MAVDTLFTDGVIAVREKSLLKDKILRMCEVGADDAFRMLVESGFGGSESVSSVHEYEKLVLADSRAIDDFIREYSPFKAAEEYLLSPRDFHNAKALTKAEFMQTDETPMLAPDGLIPVETMRACFRSEDFTPLGDELKGAIDEAKNCLKTDGSGAKVGAIFDKALYKRLSKVCAKNRLLKKFVADKADMTNILVAMRSKEAKFAADYYVEGGKLSADMLSSVFNGEDAALKVFDKSGMESFLKICFEAKNQGLPMTAAERKLSSYETDFLAANKYDLKKNQPFLYYVFRRRAENENVRIIFVCLLNGMSEKQIKSRLRGV